MRSAGSAPSMIGITMYPSKAPSGARASWAPLSAARRNSASIRSALAVVSNFLGLNEQAATRTWINMSSTLRARSPSINRDGPGTVAACAILPDRRSEHTEFEPRRLLAALLAAAGRKCAFENDEPRLLLRFGVERVDRVASRWFSAYELQVT